LKPRYDPLYLHSLRETAVILLLFAIFCGWAVGVYYVLGLRDAGDAASAAAPVSVVFGMPAWVFYGLFLPWIVVNVVAFWFSFGFMKDDDLGRVHEDEDLAEQIERQHEKEHHDA
jgi:fatty acid desaturase